MTTRRLGVLLAAAGLVGCSASTGEWTGAEGSEVTACPSGSTLSGVDVSHWDGAVDWNQVRASGVTFAFAKATEGTSSVDSTFATNWAGMKAAGIVRGAYHFFHPDQSASAQASLVAKTVGALGADDLPIVLDLEVTGGLSEPAVVASALTFLQDVTQLTGKTAILYTSPGFLSSWGGLTAYPLWVANYGVSCPKLPAGFSAWQMWQSSPSGSTPGISSHVDLDTFNGSLSDLLAFASGTTGGGGSSGGSGGSGSSGSSSGGGGTGSGSGSSSGGTGGTCGAVPAGMIARSDVLANAEQWVSAQLAYCQSPNGQPDPDPSCSSTCQRTSSAAWDPYRSDCSGLVSWAWQLAAPGLVTDEFAPFATTVSTTIQCADLRPGDAVNRDSGGHMMLFKAWVTPGQQAVFIEEPGCSAAEPYAHEFTSAVTCSGTDASIAYEGTTFTAIRYANIVDDPPCGGSGSGGGSGSSGGGSGSSSGSSSGGAPGGGCQLAGQTYGVNTCTETLQCDSGSWVTRTSDPSTCATGVEPGGGCVTDSGSVVPQNTCTSTLQCDGGVWVDRFTDPSACL